jgi:hypothetical protein
VFEFCAFFLFQIDPDWRLFFLGGIFKIKHLATHRLKRERVLGKVSTDVEEEEANDRLCVCDCPRRGRRPLRAPSIACRRHETRGTPSSATDSRPFLGSQLPSTSHRILRSNQQHCYLSLLDVLAQYPLIDFTGNRAHNWRRFFSTG